MNENNDRQWHNGGGIEIHFYTRSLRKAARALLERRLLEDPHPSTDWDGCPIVLLYRQALELDLKEAVSEGGKFLKVKTDPISLAQTHSLRWLAQIVCHVIKAVQWEAEFRCDGVATLADFTTLVNDVDSLDPVNRVVHSFQTQGGEAITHFYRNFDALRFSRRMDAVLDLLEWTADNLAAEWDLRQNGMPEFEDDFKPTIH